MGKEDLIIITRSKQRVLKSKKKIRGNHEFLRDN